MKKDKTSIMTSEVILLGGQGGSNVSTRSNLAGRVNFKLQITEISMICLLKNGLHANPVTSKSLYYPSLLDLLAAVLKKIFRCLAIRLHKYTGLCGPDSEIYFANFCNQVKCHERKIKH